MLSASILRKLSLAILILTPLFVPAQVFAQGLSVMDPNAQQGMLMSLSSSAGVAEPASDKTAASLIGVLASPEESLVQQPGEANIKQEGVVSALVSTLNGEVRVGDRIAPSSVVGVGAKLKSSGWIVGTAQGSLDAHTSGAVRSETTDNTGAKHQVYIARIALLVHVTYFTAPGSPQTQHDSIIPNSIQQLADNIAGKHVSTLAIILSFVLMFLGVVLAAQLVKSAISSGFAAIARQPLTRSIILRKVLQAFAFSGVIIVLVFLGAYLILRIL